MRRCNDCRINKKSAVKQQQKVAGITNTNSSSNKNNYVQLDDGAGEWLPGRGPWAWVWAWQTVNVMKTATAATIKTTFDVGNANANVNSK